MPKSTNPRLSNTGVVNTSEKNDDLPLIRILIDWLSFTFVADDITVDEVFGWFEYFLNISPSDFKPGRRFYQGYKESAVFENITIYWEGSSNQGVHVSISGQGCRFLDIHYQKLRVHAERNLTQGRIYLQSWEDLLRYLYYVDDINITRIDMAVDEFINYIDVEKLFHKSLNGELTMRFRNWRPDGRFNSNGKTNGISLYYGSDKSDLQLTIYEKNKQLNLDYHWTRLELQFRRKRAISIVKEILESNNDMGYIFLGTLKHYITFRDKIDTETNKSRWPVSQFWENLLKDIEPLKIAMALPDRSIEKNMLWANKQWSRTFARMYYAFDGLYDGWVREIFKEGHKRLNDEDLRLIQEFRRLHKYKKEKKEIDNAISTQ